MALFNECMQWCAHIVLDTADIVREGDVRQNDIGALIVSVGQIPLASFTAQFGYDRIPVHNGEQIGIGTDSFAGFLRRMGAGVAILRR